MPKRALSAAAVERLKPPAVGQIEHFDQGYPGLALRVSYGGSRSWVFFYRVHGKQRRMTFGRWPAMTLAGAREAWRQARTAVERGEDPAAAKVEARRREPDTVRSVGKQFAEKYLKRNRTGDEVARMLEQHLYPSLGHRPIETITRRDILDVVDTIEAKSSGARANRVLANVKRLFSWAVERGIINASPAANVKPPAEEEARDRALSDDELRAFLRACEALGEPFGPLFRLLLLTGQRREEVAGLPWTELDLPGAIWHLPGARTKNKRASDVPLAEQTVAILNGLTRRSALVFPDRSGARGVSGFSVAKARLDALMIAELRKADPEAELPAWRLHDLRRTAASGMARLGVAVHVVEAILNHKSGTISGVTAVYQRYDFAAEKRTAVQTWADFSDGLLITRPSNVVVLERS
jgi:integrase